MKVILATILTAVFANNCVFSGCFGVAPLLGISSKKHTRLALSCFSACILFLTSIVTYLLGTLVLGTLDMSFLPYVCAVVLSVVFGLLGNLILSKTCSGYAKNSRAYLMIAVLNSAILGISVTTLASETILDAVLTSLGAALGLVLATVLFGAVRSKINDKFVPKAFRGLPIDLLTACIMSMAFIALM